MVEFRGLSQYTLKSPRTTEEPCTVLEQAVELINEHIISLLVLAARRGTINTEEVDSLLGHR